MSSLNIRPSAKPIYASSGLQCPQQALVIKSQVVNPCKQKSTSQTPFKSTRGLLHRGHIRFYLPLILS